MRRSPSTGVESRPRVSVCGERRAIRYAHLGRDLLDDDVSVEQVVELAEERIHLQSQLGHQSEQVQRLIALAQHRVAPSGETHPYATQPLAPGTTAVLSSHSTYLIAPQTSIRG